jgi:hypothetical protein
MMSNSVLVLDRPLHWTTYRHHRAEELVTIVARLRDTRHHYRRTFTRLTGHQRSWIIRAEYRLLIDVEQEVVTAPPGLLRDCEHVDRAAPGAGCRG